MFLSFLFRGAPAARRRTPCFPRTIPQVEVLEDRLLLYSPSGDSWSDTNVSFSYLPDGTEMPGGKTSSLMAEMDSVAATAVWQREFARALQTWAQYTPLNFHQVNDDGSAYGVVGYSQGDTRFGDTRLGAMPSAGLAQASFPSSSTIDSTSAGDIILNTNYTFGIGSDPDFYSLMLHESGHTLGLDHSDEGTVMYGAYQGVLTGLTADDIAGIQSIYGVRQPDSYDAASTNDSLNTATQLSLVSGGRNFQADVTTQSDADFYRVVAPSQADGTLSVSVDARGLSLLAPRVSVFDGSGNLLGQVAVDDDGYGTVANLSLSGLTAGATYYLVADGATEDAFGMGAYVFDVRFGMTGGSAAPGITVSPVSGLTTSENGGAASFSIVLDSQPSADVTIELASGDVSEGTVSVSSITFTPSNWNTPQPITITGVDDVEVDGSVAYTVFTAAATSLDADYNGLNPADVSVTNSDNDVSPPAPELAPDRFEVNDTVAGATDLGMVRGGGTSEAGLTIHSATDADFFRFTPQKDGTYRVDAAFAQLDGDLDLRVLDEQENEIALGNSATDNESLALVLGGGRSYVIHVFGVNGATNTYDLSITKMDSGGGTKGNGNNKGKKLQAPEWLLHDAALSEKPESERRSTDPDAPARVSGIGLAGAVPIDTRDSSGTKDLSSLPTTAVDHVDTEPFAAPLLASTAEAALGEWRNRLVDVTDSNTGGEKSSAALETIMGDADTLEELLLDVVAAKA